MMKFIRNILREIFLDPFLLRRLSIRIIKYFLPRILCYFDDTIGDINSLFNDYTGERLAINEFNEKKEKIKITEPYYFLNYNYIESWYHQIWIIHLFLHKNYNSFISFPNKQLKI